MNSSLRVLVVDDDHPITDTLVLILRSAGFKAMGVYSAAEARDFLSFKPDLLLADVMLGDGNGLELATEFRRTYPDCRILLFSGQVTIEELTRMQPGAEDYRLLSKPLQPKQLISLIANLFEHSTTASA